MAAIGGSVPARRRYDGFSPCLSRSDVVLDDGLELAEIPNQRQHHRDAPLSAVEHVAGVFPGAGVVDDPGDAVPARAPNQSVGGLGKGGLKETVCEEHGGFPPEDEINDVDGDFLFSIFLAFSLL